MATEKEKEMFREIFRLIRLRDLFDLALALPEVEKKAALTEIGNDVSIPPTVKLIMHEVLSQR